MLDLNKSTNFNHKKKKTHFKIHVYVSYSTHDTIHFDDSQNTPLHGIIHDYLQYTLTIQKFTHMILITMIVATFSEFS